MSNWIVQVSFDVNEKPTYKATSPSGVGYPNQYRVNMKPGEQVQWKPAMPGASIAIYFEHAVLFDPSTMKAVNLVTAKNGNPTGALLAHPNHNPNDLDEYPYSVAIYDKTTDILHLHDPKIIIGSGQNLQQLVENVEVNAKLVELELSNPKEPRLKAAKSTASENRHEAEEGSKKEIGIARGIRFYIKLIAGQIFTNRITL